MKKILFTLAILFSVHANSQVSVADMLNLDPKTTTERDAISIAQGLIDGSIVLNSTTGTLQSYNGSQWVDLGGFDGNDFVTGGSVTGQDLTLTIPNQTNPVIDLSDFALDSDLDTAGTDDQEASEVPFTPYLTIESTNTQAAVNELKDEVDALSLNGTGIVAEGTVTKSGSGVGVITVTHNLGYAPSDSRIQLQRINTLLSTAVTVVENVTSTSFDIRTNVSDTEQIAWRIFGTDTSTPLSGSEVVSAIDTELGQTDWKSGGGTDNLGDHNATQDLDLNDNSISNIEAALFRNGVNQMSFLYDGTNRYFQLAPNGGGKQIRYDYTTDEWQYDGVELGTGGTDDQTLAEVLSEGNQANQPIDMNGNNIEDILGLQFRPIGSSTLGWEQRITTASNDLAFLIENGSGTGNYTPIIAKINLSGTPTDNEDLTDKEYVDDAVSGLSGTDDQNITGGTYNPSAETLEVNIENGTTTAIDVSPLVKDTELTTAISAKDEAEEIPYDNTTSGLTATDTQGAIDELAASSGSSSSLAPTDIGATDKTLTQADFGKYNYTDNTVELTVDNAPLVGSRAVLQPTAIDEVITVIPDTGVSFVGNGTGVIADGFQIDSLNVANLVKLASNLYSVSGYIKPYSPITVPAPTLLPDMAGAAAYPNSTNEITGNWSTTLGKTFSVETSNVRSGTTAIAANGGSSGTSSLTNLNWDPANGGNTGDQYRLTGYIDTGSATDARVALWDPTAGFSQLSLTANGGTYQYFEVTHTMGQNDDLRIYLRGDATIYVDDMELIKLP